MTYYRNEVEALQRAHFQASTNCLACGKKLLGPSIGYDFLQRPDGEELAFSGLFHRDCAFAMAQRIINDAWINRRDGALMLNDR